MRTTSGISAIIYGIGFGAIYFVYLAIGIAVDAFEQLGAL